MKWVTSGQGGRRRVSGDGLLMGDDRQTTRGVCAKASASLLPTSERRPINP